MNRQEFIRQLEYLLRGIPENERMDALAYYNDYFDEAGVENEYRVMKELGSPETVAESIIANYNSTRYGESAGYENGADYQGAGGYGNASGYQSAGGYENASGYQSAGGYENASGYQSAGGYENASGYQNAGGYENPYGYQGQVMNQPKEKNRSKVILIVLLLVLTFPIWIGVVAGLFGGLVGLLGGLFGAVVGLGGAGIGILAGGIACVIAGIFRIITASPIEGIVTIGVGAFLIALSILFILLFAWLGFRWIPMLVKICIKWCKNVFNRQKGGDEI